MLLLRRSILAHLSPPILHLHRRLLSTAAAAVPPNPSFAVKDYLIDTCGLTRAQALKASPNLSHLRSPTKPDAVLAFLAGLGLSSADVAAVVAKDSLFLCAKVEETLAPNVAGLTGLGLSNTEIARLVSLVPLSFRQRSIISILPYYLPLFGSFDNFLQVLKHNTNLLSSSLDKVVKPNVQFLRKCGLSARDITKLCNGATWLLSINPEHLPKAVACAEGLGVPRGSAMFRHALQAVAFLSEEKFAAQVENLKNMLRWSEAEVGNAVYKFPSVLTISKGQAAEAIEMLFVRILGAPTCATPTSTV